MGNSSPIVFSGIAPHPPIMVPEVGHGAIADVRGSINAMAELTNRIVAAGAETVVLISPHAPLAKDAFTAYQDEQLYGNFADFRAPATELQVALDGDLLSEITRVAADERYEVRGIVSYNLDHGTAVPLYFLHRNGWNGRLVPLGYSFLSNNDHLRFGSCIRKAIMEIGRPVAIIASGDLSHRLTPEAPAGFNPTAYIFDEEVVDALRCNVPDRIINMDQDLRRTAGECGYRSMLVALGATRGFPMDCEVLHYEAPFGVGYLVGQLTNNKAAVRRSSHEKRVSSKQDYAADHSAGGQNPPALAREAVETFVLNGTELKPSGNVSEMLLVRASCFVSLKTLQGQLRGCVGTIEPVKATLAEELIANAINAAARDPRFPPVSAAELPNLRYSVDVLSEPEPAGFADLDPAVYGVIVEDELGLLRGLLLPDLEGVDTVYMQVEIAARKAGIRPGTSLKLSRFRVSRYSEEMA
jgi:AmmeMemoRadiSam system protein A/AmmeMemoRadiSam system protein B